MAEDVLRNRVGKAVYGPYSKMADNFARAELGNEKVWTDVDETYQCAKSPLEAKTELMVSGHEDETESRHAARDAQDEDTCTPSVSASEDETLTPRSACSLPFTNILIPREAARVCIARDALLAYRVLDYPSPYEVATLRASFCSSTKAATGTKSTCKDSDSLRAQSGSHEKEQLREKCGMRRIAAKAPAPKSENAYRLQTQISPEFALDRSIRSKLNKICPENVNAIADQILAIDISSGEELEFVISRIVQKALAEPHYSETYADLVFRLKAAIPKFQSHEGGRVVSVKSALLDVCQNEFESISAIVKFPPEEVAGYDAEEINALRISRKSHVLATMRFIGNLFLRELLPAKVLNCILKDLTMCQAADEAPAEHILECLCEFLTAIGFTLESTPAGKIALSQVLARVLDLRERKDKTGRSIYSKRVQFRMQDLLDLHAAGWAKKEFKSAAKTKEEIRLEQHKDIDAKLSGQALAAGQRVIAGRRPRYLLGAPAIMDVALRSL